MQPQLYIFNQAEAWGSCRSTFPNETVRFGCLLGLPSRLAAPMSHSGQLGRRLRSAWR